MVNCIYLVMEVIAMAMPLMEPSLSKVTELFTSMKIAENPTVNEALAKKLTIINTTHRGTLLLGFGVGDQYR